MDNPLSGLGKLYDHFLRELFRQENARRRKWNFPELSPEEFAHAMDIQDSSFLNRASAC